MECRRCGTEIADKALVCFRCGTATTEARFKAPPRRPQGTSSWPMRLASIIALALLVLLAVYMGQAPGGGAPRAVVWAAVAFAVAVVALRMIARRR